MTNEEFKIIIDEAAKRIEGNVVWTDDPQHSGAQEFRMPIQSDEGYPLYLIGRYNDAMGKLTYAMIHQSEGCIYRLDLGAKHRNPPPPEGGRGQLLDGTHKHYWTERYRDKWAYQPNDITAIWAQPLAVWRQFCAEAGIEHQGQLADPTAQGELLL